MYAKKAVESGAPSPLEQLDEHLLACETELGCLAFLAPPSCAMSRRWKYVNNFLDSLSAVQQAGCLRRNDNSTWIPRSSRGMTPLQHHHHIHRQHEFCMRHRQRLDRHTDSIMRISLLSHEPCIVSTREHPF